MKDNVYKVISQVMNVPLDQVNEDTSPGTVKEWDSLKHMNLILALEEEFGVQFTDDQIVEMLNTKIIVSVISTLKNLG